MNNLCFVPILIKYLTNHCNLLSFESEDNMDIPLLSWQGEMDWNFSVLANEGAWVSERCSGWHSSLLCRNSSYWVTNYLPQTNRCLIWSQFFNCTVEIIHYTSLTAACGSSQLCLQVQSLYNSIQTDLCVSLLQIQRVYYSSAGKLSLWRVLLWVLSATFLNVINKLVSFKANLERWVIPVSLAERSPALLGIWC